jgi:hypothetical protein
MAENNTYKIETKTCKDENIKNMLSIMSSMLYTMSSMNQKVGANYDDRVRGDRDMKSLREQIDKMRLENGEIAMGTEDEWWASMGVDKKKEREEEKQKEIERLSNELQKLQG